MKISRCNVRPYTTKDGSQIRELAHPHRHGWPGKLSLAEATVAVGRETMLHRHLESDEIYYILAGEGILILGPEKFQVEKGDTLVITAGTEHRLRNSGAVDLVVLCCCAPPYRHEDTELVEENAKR